MAKKENKAVYDEQIKKAMNSLLEIVNNTQNIIDNQMYDVISDTLLKYSKVLRNSYAHTSSINNYLEQYIELSYKLIYKYNKNNNKKIQHINDFINIYVKKNLDYKYSIFKEFLSIGIIEERVSQEYYFINYFKKVLQVLSANYKESNTNLPEEIFAKSKVNAIQQKAKKIVKYIIELNKKSKLINDVELIKPTNSVMEIMVSLSDVITDDEDTLKKLIDGLYKLFWERGQKIKDCAQNKELNFVNDIRTYYYHDIEHGDASDIRRKYRKVKNFYKEACGKAIPETAKDWQNVQECIYNKLILFLENIKIEEEIAVAS